MSVAELVCQVCGAVSHRPLPSHGTDTMPFCKCGGRRQVVRVKAERRKGSRPVDDNRRRDPAA